MSYDKYTVMDTKSQLRICDSFYLPVYFVRRVYDEYESRQAVYSREEAKTHAEKNFANYLEKLTQKGVLILEKHVMIRAGKKKYTVSGSITVLENTFQYATTTVHVPDAENEGNAVDESE